MFLNAAHLKKYKSLYLNRTEEIKTKIIIGTFSMNYNLFSKNTHC